MDEQKVGRDSKSAGYEDKIFNIFYIVAHTVYMIIDVQSPKKVLQQKMNSTVLRFSSSTNQIVSLHTQGVGMKMLHS